MIVQEAVPATRYDVVVLTAGGPLAEAVFNAVAMHRRNIAVIQELGEIPGEIARRWFRLLGAKRALGQLAFAPLQKLAAFRAQRRRTEILQHAGLQSAVDPDVPRRYVPSVNSDSCRQALTEFAPRVVLVVGTRMIRTATLSCIQAPFINYHAGLNPRYRGQYGGYWALANGDVDHAGVTVHLIDAGVDTGASLYTALFATIPTDSIATIHYRQVVVAMPLILRVIGDALDGTLAPKAASGPSKQWFHPTAFEYITNGLRRGLW
jgi:folate-dependent phosphoribosylglycinamide formyltransferase PurN